MAERPRVGFVGGLGRSGSTLLELCLGGLPQVCAVGELVHVWQRGIVENQLCGCGRHFHECPFWLQVGDLAFGGWDRVDVGEVLELRRSVDRNRFVPRLLLPRPGRAFLRRTQEYDRRYHSIYAAVLEVSQAEVVIDSSKHVSLAACLRWDPALDLRLVHMTRDSRGVAHSWSKQVQRPEIADAVVYMPQYSATQASIRWLTQNTLLEMVSATGTPRLHVRYEDFVERPREATAEIMRFVGLPIDDLPFVDGSTAILGGGHTASGNRSR